MEQDQDREITGSLGTTQIIFAALLTGVISFYAIVVVIVLKNPAGLTPVPGLPLPAAGCLLATVLTLASFPIKWALLRRARKPAGEPPDSTLHLLLGYRQAHILAGALCEGGAMALGVFVIASGPGSLPWLAGGMISLVGFALHFPTREKFDAFLADLRAENASGASEP